MISEGAQLTGESGKVYLAVSPLGQANVWTAVETNSDNSNIVVIKEPGAEDTQPGWPHFQNEMVMHELFKNCASIRKQVDRIPPAAAGDPPMLVLEITETTLWTARTKRPFTTPELKTVTKAALVGLAEVHDRGLVYADLKMQNIMLDGFDVNKPTAPSDLSKLVAKLGDLGIVMPPCTGKVQPVSYRAPEVYFKGEITSKADIWGWGLIYCHLLEARNRFTKTGIYDDLATAHGTLSEREDAISYAISNDYKIQEEAYFREVPLPPNDEDKEKGDQWELLRRRGLEEGEVDFLRWVMRADPRKRPSARQILECAWLDKTDAEVPAGFAVPANGVGRASMEFDPRRSNPVNRSSSNGSAVNPTAASTKKAADQDVIGNALNEAYASRATYKRHLSQTPEDVPIMKKAYTSEMTSSGPAEHATQQNGANSYSAAVPDPATPQQSSTRPGLSTTNTGTFLSYR